MDMFVPPPKPDEVPAHNKLISSFEKMVSRLRPCRCPSVPVCRSLPRSKIVKDVFAVFTDVVLHNGFENPKDDVVSYHHHSKIVKGHDFVSRFEDFIQSCIDDDLMYGPYWLHLKEALERRYHPNLHFMFYEDMNANPLEELKKLKGYLSMNLSENQLRGIANYTSFEEMKARGVTPILDFEKSGVKMNVLNEDIVKKDGGMLRKVVHEYCNTLDDIGAVWDGQTFSFAQCLLTVHNKMELISGHAANPISGFERDKLLKDFRGYTKGLIRLTPGRWLLPQGFTNFARRIYNFQHKESDVVVMTWPKCGTTWMQELVWTMRNNPNFDNPDAELPIDVRSPYFELDAFLPPLKTEDVHSANNPLYDSFKRWCPGRPAEDGIYLQLSGCLPDPRVLKTHLPFSLLSPSLLENSKVVYIARNPKDVIVSYHHHSRINRGHAYVGTFEDFIQYFVDDDLLYGPYWLHLEEAWKRRNHPNLHFVFYEDLKKNPLGEIRVLNSFLNLNLKEAQLERIVKYTSFEEMRKRDNAVVPDVTIGGVQVKIFNEEIMRREGGFFRKGEYGDWKSKLAPEMDAKVDQWIHKNLDGLVIKFNYERSQNVSGKL